MSNLNFKIENLKKEKKKYKLQVQPKELFKFHFGKGKNSKAFNQVFYTPLENGNYHIICMLQDGGNYAKVYESKNMDIDKIDKKFDLFLAQYILKHKGSNFLNNQIKPFIHLSFAMA